MSKKLRTQLLFCDHLPAPLTDHSEVDGGVDEALRGGGHAAVAAAVCLPDRAELERSVHVPHVRRPLELGPPRGRDPHPADRGRRAAGGPAVQPARPTQLQRTAHRPGRELETLWNGGRCRPAVSQGRSPELVEFYIMFKGESLSLEKWKQEIVNSNEKRNKRNQRRRYTESRATSVNHFDLSTDNRWNWQNASVTAPLIYIYIYIYIYILKVY